MAQGVGGVGARQGGQAGNKNSMTRVLQERVGGSKDKISESFRQAKGQAGVGFKSQRAASGKGGFQKKVDFKA